MSNFLKNYFSTLFFIGMITCFYSSLSYYQGFFSGVFQANIFPNFFTNYHQIIAYIILCYIILLVPFYYFFPAPSKARICLNYMKNKILSPRLKISKIEKISFLSWGVKGFFAPIMIFWCVGHLFSLLNLGHNFFQHFSLLSKDFLLFFNQYFFFFLLSGILFIDVIFFTLGYLLEGKIFKNQIISVDTTFFGWFVCLMCYPPFNILSNNMLGWYSQDFPQFGIPFFHISLNLIILFFMTIYARASWSLGLKASNLTNRGVITKGPYKYVRHPAYISKNIVWWIGGLPFLFGALENGNWSGFFIGLFSLIAWSSIYFLRAITEENHLSHDTTYVSYKSQVPYRFIPGWK